MAPRSWGGPVTEPPTAVRDGLQAWAVDQWGPGATVEDLRDLGGHSGQTFGFAAVSDGRREELVVRLAPAGVARSSSTDVLRQAPLLKVLAAQGVRVAPVRGACGDERFFGVSFLVVGRLPGQPLLMGPDHGPAWLAGEDRQEAYGLAAEQLADIHGVDCSGDLAGWEAPKSPADEIDFYLQSFNKSPEPEWASAGAGLRERLLATQPGAWIVGLCHGDFQTNNVLFAGRGPALRATGVVDWELAHIGAVELDLAWFLMMNDAEAWDPVEQRGGLDLDRVLARYETRAGRALANLRWFWALACYRIAAIACYHIRLHRNGRKLDASWERASSSVPRFFTRAHALLEQAR